MGAKLCCIRVHSYLKLDIKESKNTFGVEFGIQVMTIANKSLDIHDSYIDVSST